MKRITITAVREWAQTIVLVGTVISSCVVLVFKVGGYTTRLEKAVSDATALGTQAVTENGMQQKQLDFLMGAEERRQKAEDRREARERIIDPRLPRFEGLTVK